MKKHKRIKRIAAACRRVAEQIEHRQRPMRIYRRNCVFDEEGRAACPFGHALAMAGLKPHAPYRVRRHKDAAWVPLYMTNEGTFEAIAGRKPDPELEETLWALGAKNGSYTGEHRRVEVVAALFDVSQQLMQGRE